MPRAKIGLITCPDNPKLTNDDEYFAAALEHRGISVEVLPWDSAHASWSEYQTLVIRSTWDYHRRVAEFMQWLTTLDILKVPVWNPVSTLFWNLDKIYLRELASKGVSIPATVWLPCTDMIDASALLDAHGWRNAVLKPRISATAYGTILLSTESEVTDDEISLIHQVGGFLQIFVPEILSNGEMSLVFIHGKFSHAVQKTPITGDFRVQSDYGGTVTTAYPSPQILSFGYKIVQLIPGSWIYARVDIIETAGGPLLIELELIEPELFFRFSPDGADRMAAAVIDWMENG